MGAFNCFELKKLHLLALVCNLKQHNVSKQMGVKQLMPL